MEKKRDLNLKLLNQYFTRSHQIKYLGVTLDERLTWKPLIMYLKEKCTKRLPILRHVANKKWGSDRKTIRMLYLSIIQSQLNYASFLYNSACPTLLAILDSSILGN